MAFAITVPVTSVGGAIVPHEITPMIVPNRGNIQLGGGAVTYSG